MVSQAPPWHTGARVKRRNRRMRLRKATSIFQDRGMHNARRLHNEVVKRLFFALGHEAWAPSHGSLAPLLRELSLERAIPVSTMRRWYNHFLLYGETMPETKLWEQKGFIRRETRANQWTAEHSRSLNSLVRDEPWLFLDEIRDKMLAITGRLWSPSFLWQCMNKLNLSLQVVTYIARQRDEDERRQYKSALETLVLNARQCVFLDETAKDRSASRRRRFWSPRGTTPTATATFQGSHGKRYSMLAACDVEGFILDACEVVERDGSAGSTVDTEIFTLWLGNCLVPKLGNYSLNEARSIVVLDNATIHHSDEIVELIESTGAVVLYLSPYSPDLNPIEYMFGQYKQSLKRQHDTHWWHAHITSLNAVKPVHARNYFRHCSIPHVPGGEALETENDSLLLIATSLTASIHCTTVFFASNFLIN